MDLREKIAAAALAVFFLLALLRIFRAPLRLAAKVLGNTLLGFLALWGLNLVGGPAGFALGLNLWNAAVIGILGVPGLLLLAVSRWVLG